MGTHAALRQGSTDPNHKVCIFGAQYCFPTEFQIMLKEKFFKLREDCFKITDANGQLFFQVRIDQWDANKIEITL